MIDKLIAWIEDLSVRQKTLALLLILLLLIGAGVGKWVYDMRAEAAAEQEEESRSASPSAEPVSPVEGDSPETTESPTPSQTPTVSQDASAKKALKEVVPLWASLDYAETGTDSAKWQSSWRDKPAAGPSLVTQSQDNFVPLFRGIINLNANAKVDTLKKVERVWQEGNLSGWTVEMDRHLTSADGSDVLDETETVMWEFTVEQKDDGSSQVSGYTAAAADHDGHDH